MMKKITFLMAVVFLSACTELQNIAGTLADAPLTQAQIGNGLKQALEVGISEGANRLSQKDGYLKSVYKIALPEEAQKVADKLKGLPLLGDVEGIVVEKINRAAEDAATKAAPIFVDAIKGMTFQDATQILMGNDNAATNYLHNATFQALYNEFQPVIIGSLNKFGAIDYWADAVNKYNSIPFVKKMNPSLDDYVAQEALKGLFSMVEKKEKRIREDVSARTTDLMKKVFAKQDK